MLARYMLSSCVCPAWSVYVNILILVGTNHISRKGDEATVVKFCTHVGYVKCRHTDDKSPLKGA